EEVDNVELLEEAAVFEVLDFGFQQVIAGGFDHTGEGGKPRTFLQRDEFGGEQLHQQDIVSVDGKKKFLEVGLVSDVVELGKLPGGSVAAFQFLAVNDTEDHVPLLEKHLDAAIG